MRLGWRHWSTAAIPAVHCRILLCLGFYSAVWPLITKPIANFQIGLPSGELASLDPALLVTPPKGLEVGYVPIVTRQEDADQ